MSSHANSTRSAPRNLSVLCVSALSFLFLFLGNKKTHAGTQDNSERSSVGCVSCHTTTDEPTMHPTKTVHLGCTDCHGGNAAVSVPAGATPNSVEYARAKEKAHVQPRNSIFKSRSALPEETYAKWLSESYEYVKFRNPGDLRVAPDTCGAAGCHSKEVRASSTSTMKRTGRFRGAARYINDGYPAKDTHFGESYNRDGHAQAIKSFPVPTAEETRAKGILPELFPLSRWEISQPGNILRVFERG